MMIMTLQTRLVKYLQAPAAPGSPCWQETLWIGMALTAISVLQTARAAGGVDWLTGADARPRRSQRLRCRRNANQAAPSRTRHAGHWPDIIHARSVPAIGPALATQRISALRAKP